MIIFEHFRWDPFAKSIMLNSLELKLNSHFKHQIRKNQREREREFLLKAGPNLVKSRRIFLSPSFDGQMQHSASVTRLGTLVIGLAANFFPKSSPNILVTVWVNLKNFTF